MPQIPLDDDQLTDLATQRQAADQERLQQNLAPAGVTPDSRKKAIDLADQLGVDVETVEREFAAAQERARRQSIPLTQQRLERSPKLREWLSTSTAAPVAHDDLPAQVTLENRLTFGAAILRGVDNSQSIHSGFVEATGELLHKYLPGAMLPFGLTPETLTFIGRSGRTFNTEQGAALGYKSTAADAIKGPWELAQYIKETIGEQIPVMAPIMAGGVAGGLVGGPLGAVIGAAIPAFVSGVGETEGNLKDVDPNAVAPELVFLGGSAVGALDTAMPGHLGGRLARTFGREAAEQIARRALTQTVAPRFFRGLVKDGLHELSTEAVTEALQEAIGQTTGYVGAGQAVDWSQVGHAMVEAGVAGGLMGGTFSASGSLSVHARERARFAAADQGKAFFEALGQNVVDNKLYARMPAAFAEFVAHATKDGPLETVYAPVGSFVEYWQQQGIDPAVMAAELTGKADALAHAQASNSDLAIPLSAYATTLAGTDHNAFFQNELRLRADQLNFNESRALQQTIADITSGVAATKPVTPEVQASAEAIGARIYQQAAAAGHTASQARVLGDWYQGVYQELGRRFNRDPLALFNKRPLSITLDNGFVFTPAPADARIGVDIPASRGTPGESTAQRAARVQAHREAVVAAYSRDARVQDPTVDPAALRHELETRMAMADEVRAAQQQSGHGQDLLRAVAAMGGLVVDKSGNDAGELQLLGENADRRDVRDKGRPATWNSVPGVVSRGQGVTIQEALTRLQQEPRFAHLEDIRDLWDAIDEARRATPDEDVLPGTEELQALGIVPGTRWWDRSWQAAPTEGEGPIAGISDPDETSDETAAELSPRPLDQVDDRVRALEALTTDEALGVVVPGESRNAQGEVVGERGEPSYFRIHGQDREDLSAVNCTDTAEAFLLSSGVTGVIVGYPEEVNDGRVAAEMGHDFAIVEGRFLVDPWALMAAQTERAVFDLADPVDRAYVRQQYADPALWTERTDQGAWLPYRSMHLSEFYGPADDAALEELFQRQDRLTSHMDRAAMAVTRIRRLTAAPSPPGQQWRQVPTPAVDARQALMIFNSAGGLRGASSLQRVPFARLISTQETVNQDVVEAYIQQLKATGTVAPGVAVEVGDQWYLVDGHHRTIAQWAMGGTGDVELRVMVGDQAVVEAALANADAAAALTGRAAPGATPTGILRDDPAAAQLEEDRDEAIQQYLDAGHSREALFQLSEATTPEGFDAAAGGLEPREVAKFRRDTAESFVAIFDSLPVLEDFTDVALAGAAKKGWYQRSTKAIYAVFGQVDAPRFMALLAATSPRNEVYTNLRNSLRIWIAWDDAGRPTDRKAIVAVMRRALPKSERGADGKPGKGVLPSWVNNTVRALATADPLTIVLSGPKVDSFMQDLFGNLQAVTNDAWMANFALVDQTIFDGELQSQGTDPGKGPGYLAMSSKVRLAARALTRSTGVLWTPAHVQETIWSWVKTLYELSDATGQRAVTILKTGGLTDNMIDSTPDFGTLFTKDATVRELLEAAGYGEVLSAFEKHLGRVDRGRAAAATRAGAGQTADAASRVTPGTLRAARRLDRLWEQRRANDNRATAAAIRAKRRQVAAARRAAAVDTTELYQRQAYPGVDVKGTFATTTALTATGTRELGTRTIKGAEDLATAMQAMGSGAVERFDAVVTSARGVPLAIVGSFKGRVDQSVVHGEVVLAEALQVPGAAGIWFVHNHPSGDATLSTDDQALEAGLAQRFRDTGITPHGIMAITASGAFHHYKGGFGMSRGQARGVEPGRKVPIVEREFRSTGKLGERLTGPTQVLARIDELTGGEYGVLLLDTKLAPLAFLPVNPQDAGGLRASGALTELLKGLSVANPTSAIINVPHPTEGAQESVNLARALKVHGVGLLDVVFTAPTGARVSALIQNGNQPLNVEGEFYQRTDEPITGMYSRVLQAVANSKQDKASGAQWKATIRNAGVNLDEFSLLGVEQLDDAIVYSRERLHSDLLANSIHVEVTTFDEKRAYSQTQLSDLADELFEKEVESLLADDELEDVGVPGAITFTDEFDGDTYWVATLGDDEIGRGATYDTEEEALAAAVAAREELEAAVQEDRRNAIANGLDFDDFVEKAEGILREREGDAETVSYEQYTEPGADKDSYREVFLTAPHARRVVVEQVIALSPAERSRLVDMGLENRVTSAQREARIGSEAALAIGKHYLERAIASLDSQVADFGYQPGSLAHAMVTDARAILQRILDSGLALTETRSIVDASWSDGHEEYDNVQNPIVRVRYNTRTAADGTTTMFLEEVQPPHVGEQKNMPGLFTKHWRELAFKWAIQHATEKGYHQVAWTSGRQQAARYSLAQVVRSISVITPSVGMDAQEHGVQRLLMIDRGANNTYVQLGVNAQGVVTYVRNAAPQTYRDQPLAAIVGEELAARIMGSAENDLIDGEALEIGGYGLKKLYDVDFVNVVNKLPVVKRGGGKVAQLAVPFGKDQLPAPAATPRTAIQQWYQQHPPFDSIRHVPGVAITEGMRTQARAGQALFQDSKKPGDIKGAYSPDTNTIRLVAGKADLSTFLHESGHFFLEVLTDIAVDVDPDTATPEERQLLEDLATVLKHGDFQGTLQEWRALPLEARRQVHEAWADSFEQYLFDGKAPSEALRPLMAKFRDWLYGVYRNARGKGIEISPELRGVFDRLLASDEAIADVAHEGQVVSLFSDAASAGVDVNTFAEFRKDVEAASLAAREALDARLMKDWRRERQAWWKAERAIERAKIQQDLWQEPIYRALSVMRTGLLPDGTVPSYGTGQPMKLSKAVITREVPQALAQAVLAKRPAVFSVEGGTHPDTAAELFGFATGEALLEAIVQAKPMEQVLDATADQRMRERHGDLLLDGMELKAIAEGAVFDQRAKVISAELKALSTGLTKAVIPPAAVLKQQAEQVIRRTRVRELNPGRYLAGARRLAQASFWAFNRNDRKLAITHKQGELAALAFWRAARDAKERADVVRDKLKRYADKASTRARIGKAGQEYLDQIDGFLDRYEFATVSNKALERRRSLREFVKQVEADGLPNPIPEALLDEAQRTNWRELTVEELEGVGQAIDQIAHLAGLKNKLLTARNKRELDAVRAEIAATIYAALPKRELPLDTRDSASRREAFFEGILASHRKMASLVRELDGFKDGGPMWEAFQRPLNDAGNREATKLADATTRLGAIFTKHYTRSEHKAMERREWVEALGPRDKRNASVSKMNRLLVALNWGNEKNRQRLRDGRGWSDAQVQAILEGLDKRDWEFVQDVWDFVNSYWPEIVAKEQRVKGVAPIKEEAIPVYTRHGEFAGGYFPLMFDERLSAKVKQVEEADLANAAKAAAYLHNVTAHGHVEARVEGDVKLPVRLDFGVIFEHTARVIHDLTHHEALLDAQRVLNGPEVQTAIYDTLGPTAFDQFRRGLHAIAVGDIRAQQEMESGINFLRAGATIAGLGWSVTTSLLQPIGLTQSMQRIGVKWVGKGLQLWLTGGREHAVAAIVAKSELMANRFRTMNRELNEVRNTLSPGSIRNQAVTDSFFYLIGKMQMTADVPTWLGAYAKAQASGVDEATAVALADQAVLDSQGGGQMKDLAAVQRGGPSWKVWTNFYSFFNTTYNLWIESVHQAKVERDPRAIARLAADALLLFVVPAAVGHVLRAALTGDLGDELEDPEQLFWALAGEELAYMAGTMIGLREVAGFLQGYAGYEGPAGARGFSATGKLAKQVGQIKWGDVAGGDFKTIDEALLRAGNAAAGIYFHYPASQIDKTVRGMLAIINGDSVNPFAPLVGPGRNAH